MILESLVRERFELLEKRPMTVSEFARRVWISKRAAAVWLSRMTNHKRPDGKIRHYLVYEAPQGPRTTREHGERVRVEGTYKVAPGCDWWGEMFFDHDRYDIYG